MTDDFSEGKRDFDFEKLEVEALKGRITEVYVFLSFAAYCLLLFVGYLCWIVTGDLHILMRTSILALVGAVIVTYCVTRIGITNVPSHPLPDHPDMMREDEL